jgi:hypothetical protein
MTRLSIAPRIGIMIGMMSLCWFSPAHAQQSTNGVDEKAFREFVTKYKTWKVDSAWGRVTKQDQENYHFSPLASMMFSSKKFDGIDQKGKHTKGKWSTSMFPEGDPRYVLSFYSNQGRNWFLTDYAMTGSKLYLVIEQDVCSDGCTVSYRLKPK